MTLALADDHLLRIAACQRSAEPRLWQLPEQRALAAIFASHFGAHQQATEQRFGRRLIQLPGQLLARRIPREQPVTGRPQRLPGRQREALIDLDRPLGLPIKAQADQRLPVQAQAQTAFGCISDQLTARRQGQGSQVIQIGHGSGSR